MAKRLTRSSPKAVLAGVAAGFAEYFDVDPVLVRIVFILLTFLHGVGALLYLVCWVIMPRAESGADGAAVPGPTGAGTDAPVQAGGSTAGPLRDSPAVSGGRIVVGMLLIGLGTAFLLERLDLLHWPHWVRWTTLWPALVIAIGITVVLSAFRRRSS